jgi:hypothetical protein
MYNGNNDNGYKSSYSGSSNNSGFRGPRLNMNNTISVGGMRMRSIYVYAALAVVAIIVIYMLINFVQTSLVMHYSVVAGALLLVTNLRELIGNTFAQRSSTALLNCLIAGGLVCAWASQILSSFMWIPAIILIAIAAPLAFGRASVYSTYVSVARNTVGGVMRNFIR